MLTTLTLTSCALLLAQASGRTEWQLVPRLSRGQELVYRGTIREQSLSRGVQFSKSYRLEIRSLVLDAKNDGMDVAFLTRIAQQQPPGAEKEGAEAASIRLELAEVDSAGRITAQAGQTSLMALDRAATWEHGFFNEVPRIGVPANHTWSIDEPGRPVRKYRVVGSESIGGTTCVKVVCEQQSEDWDMPRADSTGWRRKDTMWIQPRLGVAQRVLREIERRDPAHKEATYRLVTQYELDSSLRYDGLFLEDRKREIMQGKLLHETVTALLPQHRKHGPAAFEALVARIDQHFEKHPSTPYREILQRARELAFDASRNKVPPAAVEEVAPQRLALGKPAPEFVVEEMLKKETVSMRKWKGKTILMVFYQPNSETARVIMQHAQMLADRNADQDFVVLGLAMADDTEGVRRLEDRLKLTFPLLAGKSLRMSYEVEATPRFVVVDADGIVRGAYTGWGPEVPPALESDLRRCLPAAEAVGKAGGP